MGVEMVGHKLIEVMEGLSKLLGNRAAARIKDLECVRKLLLQ